MAHNNSTQGAGQSSTPNSALDGLRRLAGTWQIDILMPLDPPINVRGLHVITWLEEGPFLLDRGTVEHPEFPVSTAIIGGDDSNGSFSMLYSDSRGVTRIYEMSLSREEWKLW